MEQQVCDPCSRDDVEAKATTLCTDCEEKLCADCTKAHRRSKLSLAHVLLDIEKISSLPESTISSQTFCSIHNDTLLEFYCRTHDKTCCRSCIPEIHRSCPNVISLSEASKNIKSDPIIDKLSAEIENIINVSNQLLENGEMNISELKKQEKEIQKQILEMKNKVISEFDKVENALKADLAYGKKQVQVKVQGNENKMETILSATKLSQQELDFVQKYASVVQGYLQLRHVKTSLHEQANQLNDALKNITDQSLRYDNKTNWIVKSIGDIKVETTPCPVVYKPIDAEPDQSEINESDDASGHLEPTLLEIPPTEIRRGFNIKTGQYGDIWKGTWASTQTKQSNVVAVKTAKDQDQSFKHLMTQINILATLKHENIITVYGICTGLPMSMVMEFVTQGNLVQYLGTLEGRLDIMTVKLENLTSIAVQICSGMNYLYSKKIVHMDLSAKNVMIGDGNVAKIIGFANAKRLDNGDTLKMDTAFAVPIKWTAPEVLLDKTISRMSDVWSFGITTIEMMTFGKEPYPGIRKQDIFNMIKDGYRHPQTEGCPDVVYDVLLRCWAEDPNDRPTFEFLYNFFDTVTVINDDIPDDDARSVTSENSSGGSYNFQQEGNTRDRQRTESDMQEDMLPRQRSKSKKNSKDAKDEKCSIS